MKNKNQRRVFWLIFVLFVFGLSAAVSSVRAQEIPAGAALPEGRSAWVINYFLHANSIRGYAGAMQNDTRVIIQSDGVVFFRRTIQYRTFKNDSGWCQEQFPAADMRRVAAAMRAFRPNVWKASYGPLPNALAPFGVMTITKPNARDEAVGYTTKFLRFDTLPADLKKLLDEIADAGNVAFSRCTR